MKRKSLIILAFLMVLYIGPMILAPSLMRVATPTEQNTTKDFSVASGEYWLVGWSYRQEISIMGVAGSGINYQVNLTVPRDVTMGNDFEDICFTQGDGLTHLNFWLEYYGNEFAYFWIEILPNLDTNKTIYMYWGNVSPYTVSNGDATFLFYEDWTNESVRAAVWDITDANGGITYAGGASHGKIARVQGDAAATYKITSDYDTASPIALMFRANIEEAGAGNTGRMGSGHDGAFAFNLIDTISTGEKFYVYDDDGNQDSQAMTTAYFDTWVTFQITRDGTNSKLYADTILIETASCDPDIVATNPVASLRVTDSEDDIYSDWFAARKFKSGAEPVIVGNGTTESAPPITWNQVGQVTFIFHVGWDPVFQFGYDAVFIFAGLILIPLSTIFLVRGGRKDLSMDKTFYFLILFMVGLGLLIGGIMP